MNNVYVKPVPGLIVRDPQSGLVLPEGGAWKPRNAYWSRRLRDGDVMETPPPACKPVVQPFAMRKPAPSPAARK